MTDLFKPEDFESDPRNPQPLTTYSAAIRANFKMCALIEQSPKVYFSEKPIIHYSFYANMSDTHQASILFPRPIKPACSKHEPKAWWDDHEHRCKHCGIELVAEWQAR